MKKTVLSMVDLDFQGIQKWSKPLELGHCWAKCPIWHIAECVSTKHPKKRPHEHVTKLFKTRLYTSNLDLFYSFPTLLPKSQVSSGFHLNHPEKRTSKLLSHLFPVWVQQWQWDWHSDSAPPTKKTNITNPQSGPPPVKKMNNKVINTPLYRVSL